MENWIFTRECPTYKWRVFEENKKEEYDLIKDIIRLCGGCKRCGFCCNEKLCQLLEEDVNRICRELNIKVNEFNDKYVNLMDDIPYLENPCHFLNEDKCGIYRARPEVCKWHPFNVIQPFVYRIQVLDECGLSREIFKRFRAWEETRDEKAFDKDEMNEAIKKIDDEIIQRLRKREWLNGKLNREIPVIIMDSENAWKFRDFLM